jgi:hypothetical protein
MDSEVATRKRAELLAASQRLTPMERLDAFVTRCRLVICGAGRLRDSLCSCQRTCSAGYCLPEVRSERCAAGHRLSLGNATDTLMW